MDFLIPRLLEDHGGCDDREEILAELVVAGGVCPEFGGGLEVDGLLVVGDHSAAEDAELGGRLLAPAHLGRPVDDDREQVARLVDLRDGRRLGAGLDESHDGVGEFVVGGGGGCRLSDGGGRGEPGQELSGRRRFETDGL